MDKELAQGYVHVKTPVVVNTKLYKISGHLAHYKDDMFPIMVRDEEEFCLRPMNCPEHMVMYKSKLHSYRDLPVRIAEIADDFRFEASGALTGIERSRAFVQNDSHIFCRPDQIADEIKNVTKLILDVYNDFGFENYSFRLSLRDPENAEKYFGNDDLWKTSEAQLREILTEMKVPFYEAIGEAAFYGPKIDVQVRSALGHDVTLSTIQLDYQLPERFELEYVDSTGSKVRPVVIHRAILGSLDRFVAFLLEETKGNLPLWLAAKQAVIIPVSPEAHKDERLRGPGKIKCFQYFDQEFPIYPPTYFFDWLYVNALHQNPDLAEQVIRYKAFTDIEFNPARQINCQAEVAAIYVGLRNSGKLEEALKDKDAFRRVVFG